MKIWSILLALFITLAGFNAEAARFGGGRSVGKQSGNVTQREAVSKPAPQPGAAPAAGAAAAKKPWGSMLGGLAAGLGLAWLAHSLGFGEAFGQILLIALLAFAALAAYAWFKRSRAGGGAHPGTAGNRYAYQGAGADSTPSSSAQPVAWKGANAGNDIAARPSSPVGALAGAGATGGSMIGSALRGQQSTWDIPPGFDSDGFVRTAKANFIAMQAAWDKADLASLRTMTTDEMLGEIRSQLAERDQTSGGPPNQTEVVRLDAELLGIEDLGNDYMASVEFTGLIREEPAAAANPFREVWNLTKPKSGSSGWLIAGVQALQ